MRVTERWHQGPTLSFEVFPPRGGKQAASFPAVLDKLVALRPDFFGVTFGAGGSTREGSRDLIQTLVRDKGVPVVAYVACHGLGPDDLHAVLSDYRDLGVETVLAVRGDPPHDQPGFEPHPQSLPHASDFVSFVRRDFSFTVGAAAYPEGHIEATSLDDDFAHLQHKVAQGAEFLITNYCYDNERHAQFVTRCRQGGLTLPILPGVMPIYSVGLMESLSALCGATIPAALRQSLASLPPDDKQAVSAFGEALRRDGLLPEPA
jgi:methylenetetrahydrofolate reductase (NADPH)